MKKIFHFFILTLLLQSCSSSLYNRNYHFVKVNENLSGQEKEKMTDRNETISPYCASLSCIAADSTLKTNALLIEQQQTHLPLLKKYEVTNPVLLSMKHVLTRSPEIHTHFRKAGLSDWLPTVLWIAGTLSAILLLGLSFQSYGWAGFLIASGIIFGGIVIWYVIAVHAMFAFFGLLLGGLIKGFFGAFDH